MKRAALAAGLDPSMFQRPATRAEMALVEQFALEFGSDRLPGVITFRQATADRATMDTLCPKKQLPGRG